MAGTKKELQEFAKRWKDRGYEKGESVQFWIELQDALGYPYVHSTVYEHHLDNGGFVDAWLRDGSTIVEQKSLGIDLDKPEPRQGKMKTPLEQALDYVDELKPVDQPRYVVTCNFGTFRVYDRNAWSRSQLVAHPFEFSLSELIDHPEYLSFLTDPVNARLEKERDISIKAGEAIGRLYDRLAACYIDPESEASRHSLNVLCVRIVFCLFCEDADLFDRNAFYNYLNAFPASQMRGALKKLFAVLDTPLDERDPYDTDVNVFPYVDGGLFRNPVEIPNFDDETRRFLLEDISAGVDWSQISPTIFGGIFESTLNPETRRQGGMHYTSPENIHKVIDPLFMDDLENEFAAIRSDASLTPRQKKNRYARLHEKICGLSFLDPACGSGNFLTETYLCLRRLEDSILRELRQGQTAFAFADEEESGKRVSLSQFHGIEINDFAVTVAEAALWISRLKANGETLMMLDADSGDFPLEESAHIVHANALRLDWNEVLPSTQCSFVMGNPPFKGAHASEMPRTPEQTAELIAAFENRRGVAEADYVAAWFAMAANYVENMQIAVGFVATNSIGQGQQPSLIWPYLWSKGVRPFYSYRPFLWGNEANDPAAVAVTIVGFSPTPHPKCVYFETDYKTMEITGFQIVDNIGPYLKPGANEFVINREKPLCDVPEMKIGSQPIDNGNYVFKPDEMREFIQKEPGAKRFMHEFLGSAEFLNGRKRYVLWLGEATPSELENLPLCRERVEKVREFRLSSQRASTRKAAETPNHFGTEIISVTNSIAVPEVSSERRNYIPIGFMTPDVFCSNKLRLIPGADIYMFGVLHSQFHNAWMRTVAGRLENRYSYSSGVVYNNFVWPEPADEQRQAIESCAQAVLDARDNHPNDSLAILYDPDKMPADLLAAHKALDKAVEEAYGVDFNGDEEMIVAHLFKLYAEKTKGE